MIKRIVGRKISEALHVDIIRQRIQKLKGLIRLSIDAFRRYVGALGRGRGPNHRLSPSSSPSKSATDVGLSNHADDFGT